MVSFSVLAMPFSLAYGNISSVRSFGLLRISSRTEATSTPHQLRGNSVILTETGGTNRNDGTMGNLFMKIMT
jgi:hypothetical protein